MNRKQKREQNRRLKRETKSKVAKLESALSRQPDRCDECGTLFDATDSTILDEWRIAVYDNGPVHLVCPGCVPDDIKVQKQQ